jgi:protein phosphatase
MTFSLRYAVRSHIGLVRSDNQDAVYAGPRLLAVADGIGGQVGGATASRVVIATFAPLDEDDASQEMLGALRETTQTANAHLRQVIEEQPDLNGMGTTLTAMLFDGNRLAVAHVGDSRAYLMRGRSFSQITKDQTFVQALVDEGRITPEEASNHPQRSVILRALAGSEVDPDLSMREAHLGERYLLCSDGLSDYVSGDSIRDALHIDDPHEAADRLVELALRAGGRDNVTCIVADVVEADEGDEVPVVGGSASDVIEPDEVHPTSAAARAAIAVPPARDEPTRQPEPAAKHPWYRRRLSYALLVLIVAAGGLIGLYQWSQAQYFVGARDGKVVIFKGVNVSLAGGHLYHPVHTSDLALTDLVVTARTRVRSGLSADNRGDAERIVANLGSNEVLPLCKPLPTPTPTPTPTPRPTPKPSPHKPRASTHSSRPAPHTTAHRSATPTGHAGGGAAIAASPRPSLTITAGATPVHGKDCR